MLSFLRGIIAEFIADKSNYILILDVNGVGYEVLISNITYAKLPSVGANISIYTHFIVREDAQQLFGFIDGEERFLFKELIKVTGIGPKLALGILSGIEVKDFIKLIQAGDSNLLVKLPGIGKKTAERIMIEMQDRLVKNLTNSELKASLGVENIIEHDAISALMTLGYKLPEARQAVEKSQGKDLTQEALIRRALQILAKV